MTATGGGQVAGVGSIVTWGSNANGQCTVPSPNEDFIAIAAGRQHSLGLKIDGSIVAWGYNIFGQCDVPAPNADFVAIAGGWYHSLGLKADGSLVAWGGNDDGQCDVPLPNASFVAIAAGGWHSLGLRSDGSIAAWGYNDTGQCDVPAPNANFVAVADGWYHSLGLKADSSIVAWGDDSAGQCDVPAPNTSFVAVAAGANHSLGLRADGTIVAWGSNGFGQCDVPAPNADFVAIVGGWFHSLGLRASRSIVAWGNDGSGQCEVPAPNSDFVAIAGGWHHSLGLRLQLITVNPEGTGDYRTIQAALDAEYDGRTIVLADGTYAGLGNRDLNFLGKRILLRSLSDDPTACVIDCQGREGDPHRGFVFQSGESAATVVEGIAIVNGWAAEGGAIRVANGSSPTFRNCRLTGNTATVGGAIHCSSGAAPHFEHTLIADNAADLAGSVYVEAASCRFAGCTLADNHSAPACLFVSDATLELASTIVAFNGPGPSVLSYTSATALSCCDVYRNAGGDYVNGFAGALGHDGNIAVDPLFCMSEPRDYALNPGSICLPASEYSPCGALIGAYGEGAGCDLVATDALPEAALALESNYPNPFNPSTQIAFTLPRATQVTLTIYDLAGRRVRSLAAGIRLEAGRHALPWDGSSDAGQPLPSGIYLCRLEAGARSMTDKLTLLR